jgi:5-methylcytosine-specific restriction endonuclease McrA
MPMAPPRACATCGRAGCTEKHRSDRKRGETLQDRRYALFRRQPFCVRCRVEVATIRDHIVPLWAGGVDDETNTQALCVPCHNLKTQAESRLRCGQ